ncbi:MAG: hypothetical protein GXP40_00770 [Chloroflexi bacterium]|nr:hypothetical protein [Chloroflexota bacterium]
MIAIVLYLLAFAIFLFAGPLAAGLYVYLTKAGNRAALTAFWGILGLATVATGILITYTFGDFFPGPGCILTVLAPLAAIITALAFRSFSKRVDDPSLRKRITLATIIVPLLFLGAPVIGFGYARTCDALNRRAARPVIAALGAYRQDHGGYPEMVAQTDLTFLVPDYLDAIPPVACALPTSRRSHFLSDDWSLYPCRGGEEPLLMVPILGSDSQQTYNLDTGQWSVGGAFDGYCH